MPRRKTKRHERTWGQGTIHAEKRAGRLTGRWVAQLPKQDDGSRPAKRLATKPEAERWLADELARRHAPDQLNDAGQPLVRYLLAWLARRRPTIAPNTAHTYRQAVRCVGALGALPLRELTHRHFERLWAELADPERFAPTKHRPERRAALAAATIRQHRRILGIALGDAVPDLLPANPVRRAKPPPAAVPEVERWEPEHEAAFLAAADRTPLAAYWRLALGIGARPGELRALRWSDLDLTAGTVTIRRSLSEHGRLVGPTKTRRERTVYLPRACLAALRRHREQQRVESPWVFCHTAGPLLGQPIGPAIPARAFAALVAAVNDELPADRQLPAIVPYALRHTTATALLLRGIPAADVARMLGHADATQVSRVYGRWLPSGQRRVALERWPEEGPGGE